MNEEFWDRMRELIREELGRTNTCEPTFVVNDRVRVVGEFKYSGGTNSYILEGFTGTVERPKPDSDGDILVRFDYDGAYYVYPSCLEKI